jgi:hypothetical protein
MLGVKKNQSRNHRIHGNYDRMPEALDAGKIPLVKRRIFWFVLIIFVYSCFELIAYFAMSIIDKNPDPRITTPVKFKLTQTQRDSIPTFMSGKTSLIFDENLGWLLSYPHHVRTNRNISVQAESGKFRVLSFGDSFTYESV